ncbi:YdaU family protein [Sphingomonas sp. URHD0057]|uniref:YdaU family protein n=1 Tax=Sphingomonas sp. URHD0057 TaxID=1380389 RepID=UPI000490A88E|nr:DUF1376 domain-containing protein [Sphingomonas sp. URHD0057]
MAEFPALPLWTDAYLGDTTHLTTIEHGAYLLLLITAWRTSECCLPDDDRLLARYARMNGQQWKRIRPIIEAFFVVDGGQWRQRRLTDERESVQQHRARQSEKGKAGAVAKALKKQGRHKAPAKSGLASAEAGVQPDASSLLHTQEEKKERTPKPPQLPADARSVMEEGGFVSPPPDLALLKDWYALGATLDQDILPVVRTVSRNLNKPPFKLKVFDVAIREKLAADQSEIERLRRIAERNDLSRQPASSD